MSPEQMIFTSLLLGLFALLAGIYGLLYSFGVLRESHAMLMAGRVSYGAQCAVALAIVLLTALGPWWKVLVLVSCLLYGRIPPVTWRYLRRIHEFEGQHP